jgi:hypothetical protein
MNNILIVDDFLDKNELKLVLDMLNSLPYLNNHVSSLDKTKFSVRFFSTNEYSDLIERVLIKKIEKTINKILKLNRTYIHVQTYGQDGIYHIDDYGSNARTFCLYINTIKTDLDNAGGEFLLKLPDCEKIVCIDSVFNRGIYFPSYLWHKGMPYNSFYNNERICITFKFEEISPPLCS